jgi:hypothetical protein
MSKKNNGSRMITAEKPSNSLSQDAQNFLTNFYKRFGSKTIDQKLCALQTEVGEYNITMSGTEKQIKEVKLRSLELELLEQNRLIEVILC